jgi:hypothetical protein
MKSIKNTLENGTVKYLNKDGLLHKEDGPAIIWNDGSVEWFFDGRRHREDGPALILNNKSEFWYNRDRLHRMDGPSIIWNDGESSYYYFGEECTEKEYNEKILSYKLNLYMK